MNLQNEMLRRLRNFKNQHNQQQQAQTEYLQTQRQNPDGFLQLFRNLFRKQKEQITLIHLDNSLKKHEIYQVLKQSGYYLPGRRTSLTREHMFKISKQQVFCLQKVNKRTCIKNVKMSKKILVVLLDLILLANGKKMSGFNPNNPPEKKYLLNVITSLQDDFYFFGERDMKRGEIERIKKVMEKTNPKISQVNLKSSKFLQFLKIWLEEVRATNEFEEKKQKLINKQIKMTKFLMQQRQVINFENIFQTLEGSNNEMVIFLKDIVSYFQKINWVQKRNPFGLGQWVQRFNTKINQTFKDLESLKESVNVQNTVISKQKELIETQLVAINNYIRKISQDQAEIQSLKNKLKDIQILQNMIIEDKKTINTKSNKIKTMKVQIEQYQQNKTKLLSQISKQEKDIESKSHKNSENTKRINELSTENMQLILSKNKLMQQQEAKFKKLQKEFEKIKENERKLEDSLKKQQEKVIKSEIQYNKKGYNVLQKNIQQKDIGQFVGFQKHSQSKITNRKELAEHNRKHFRERKMRQTNNTIKDVISGLYWLEALIEDDTTDLLVILKCLHRQIDMLEKLIII